MGADGDVGPVEDGVALEEAVGGERVRGDGLAAGDGGMVRADVEAVAEAEEGVRRRHAPNLRSGAVQRCAGWRRRSMEGRARARWEDRVSCVERRGCYAVDRGKGQLDARAFYTCTGVHVYSTSVAVVLFLSKILEEEVDHHLQRNPKYLISHYASAIIFLQEIP